MIKLDNIHKSFRINGIRKDIIRGVNFNFYPKKNYALLGKNGAGKSTLLRLIAGGLQPNKGSITRNGKVSWPLGFSGGFNGNMTGIENIKFVARIYGRDPHKVIKYVYDFSELGKSISLPIKTYSSGMKGRLAFGLSLAIDFECYLIDEAMSVGDASFRKKCKEAFSKKIENSFLIMTSHNTNIVEKYCDCGILLDNGHVEYFDTVENLLAAYIKVNQV